LIEPTWDGQKASKKVELPEEVVMRVLSRFKANDGHLADGRAALAVAGNDASRLTWACELPAHVHTVLVWHIGTTICEMTTPQQLPLTGDRLVAKCLSEYCAYLVAFHPELLPDDKDGMERMYKEMEEELKKKMGCFWYYCS